MLKNFKLYEDDYIDKIKNAHNFNIILEILKNEKFQINHLSDFIDLIKIKIAILTVKNHFNELKNYLDEKDLNLVLSFSNPNNSWKISTQFENYIESNIEEILHTQEGCLIERTLDLICEYGTSRYNFEYIINTFMVEHQVFLIKKHKEFYRTLGKNYSNLKITFVENLLIPINIYHLDLQLKILNNYKGTFKDLQPKFEKNLLELLKSDTFTSMSIWNRKNIMNIIFISDIRNDIKLALEPLNKEINNELEIEVKKNGRFKKQKIDMSYYINLVENIDNMRDKMFFIDYHIQNKDVISTYSYIPTVKNAFQDLFSNLNNNTNYSNTFVMLMNHFRVTRYCTINYLIYTYKDLFWLELNKLYNDVLKVLNLNKTSNFSIGFQKLFSMEFYEECCSKVVREIEFLLRCMYIHENHGVNITGSKYVNIGLSEILSKPIFYGLITEEDIKCLRYILIDSGGFNYRNSISHNNIDSINKHDALYLLSVFIFLLISIDYFDC
ncbi:hypothetical protein [Paraclostridium bifermentans]